MSKIKSASSTQGTLQTLYSFTSEPEQHISASFSETGSERGAGIGPYGRRNWIHDSKNLKMYTASDVVSEPITWIYPDWLQQEELTCLAGPPGAGKTTFVCALAAGITRGETHSLAPGLTPRGAGHVIIINREDDIAHGLNPRLEAAGADLSKVHFIECKTGPGNDSPFSFSGERDMNRLIGLSERLNNRIGLIIIDPIYFAVNGDHNNNHKSREAYERLTALAKRLQCAILGISHTVRNTKGKGPLERVAGPPALREVPRSIILLSKISNGPTETGGTHLLIHAKNNEGEMDGGFEYEITPLKIPGKNGTIETVKFVITRQLFGSADDILDQADRNKSVGKVSKLDGAVKFLREFLLGGEQLWGDVEKAAQAAEVSNGTLMNAKGALQIVTKKRKGDGRSVWRLPESERAGNPLD